MVAGTVAVARTTEEARRLLIPEAWAAAHARTRGSFPPLIPAEQIEARHMTAKERELYESGLLGHIHGTEDEVAAALETLLADTGAQEVLVTTSSDDRAALLDSYRRLARLTGTSGE